MDPYIKTIALQPTDTHLIVACDGLWDVVKFQEAIDALWGAFSSGTKDPNKLAELLVKMALQKGSKDNVSVLVIEL